MTASSPIHVVVKPVAAVRVLSLRATLPSYKDQRPFWDRICAFAAAHGIAIAGACFVIYYDTEFKETDVDAEMCIPIADDVEVPPDTEEFRVYELAALKRAAATTLRGPYDLLPPLYDALFRWIDEHGEKHACVAVREVYHAMDASDATGESFVTEIIVPLA